MSVPIAQDDFNSPVIIPFTLRREETLTLFATATALTHNPEAGKTGWPYSGLSIDANVDGVACAETPTPTVTEPILDGIRSMRVDIKCGPMELDAGQHVISLSAEFIGSCKPLDGVPATFNTNLIRGGYALVE